SQQELSRAPSLLRDSAARSGGTAPTNPVHMATAGATGAAICIAHEGGVAEASNLILNPPAFFKVVVASTV
ncbi:hypothetical protein, partial [Pseudomonas syringae]|uniref:hypothetical protein n=1 Tax=Pseudomonas syringae TaxID=317 RepID=UPI001A7E198D